MTTETIISEVPLLDLNAQYDLIKDEVRQAIDRVLESQHFIMGPEVASFEDQMADYCDTDYAVGCASGSDALLLSLMALDVGPDDAVLTTPFTFFATAGAIARLGATPVFLDIDPLSYNLDPRQLAQFLAGDHPLNEKLDITAEDVKAIIPVHLYGQMADMNPIMEVAGTYDIPVIEDAAQAIGAEYKGRRAGSVGNFGCFSFFPSKNLGGYGDGGLVTTNDAEMAEKLRVLCLHGAKPKYHHHLVGINSRLDALQAAVLKVKLDYLDQWSAASRENALFYNQLFENKGLVEQPEGDEAPAYSGDPQKILPPIELEGDPQQGGRHVYHQYTIRTNRRDELMKAFNAKNIGYSVYYPVPLHEQECFKYLGYESSDCPHATAASRSVLALPMYPELTDAQQEYVVEIIEEAIKGM